MTHRSSSTSLHGRFRGRRTSTFRPTLEQLEDRIVPSTISGTLTDTSANAGLAGWTVWLDVNNNQHLDTGDVVTTTDANGKYFFDTTNVPPGITGTNGAQGDVVRVDLPSPAAGSGGRWVNTTPIDALINRTTTPDATQNFGVMFQQDTGVTPVGSESPVNIAATGMPQNTSLAGTNVSVSADAQGDYVVSWENSTGEAYARVFNADGTARTGDIDVGAAQVPSSSNPFYQMPQVAMAGNGEFMVAWTGPNGIEARAYSANGTPVGNTNTVVSFNSSTTGGLSGVAADSTGDFVVVYHTESFSKGVAVYAQRYKPSGSATGGPIKVATPQLNNGVQSVAMDSAGNFVVAWDDAVNSRNGTSASYVYAQKYNASGTKSGNQITVASGTTSASGETLWPSVAMNATGQFAVTYQLTGAPAVGRVQVYNANGTPAGAVVSFSTSGEADLHSAAVAMDSAGDVLLSWCTGMNNYDRQEVRMAWLAAGASTPLSGPLPETIVSTTTQGSHQLPGVAATGNGTFVIAWQGYGAADPAGIYSQRYAPVSGAAAMSALILQSTTGGTTPAAPKAATPATVSSLAPAADTSGSVDATIYDPSLMSSWLPMQLQNTPLVVPLTGQPSQTGAALSNVLAPPNTVTLQVAPVTTLRERLAALDQLFTDLGQPHNQ